MPDATPSRWWNRDTADGVGPERSFQALGTQLAAETTNSPGDPRRVLVASENTYNRESLTRMLESIGVLVEAVTGGRSALERTRMARYDLILIDWDSLSVELYRALRDRRVPIVAMLADSGSYVPEHLLDGGIVDRLLRPVRRDEVLAVLRRWLPEEKIQADRNRPLPCHRSATAAPTDTI